MKNFSQNNQEFFTENKSGDNNQGNNSEKLTEKNKRKKIIEIFLSIMMIFILLATLVPFLLDRSAFYIIKIPLIAVAVNGVIQLSSRKRTKKSLFGILISSFVLFYLILIFTSISALGG